MNIYQVIAISFPLGFILGLVYFSGLWWTIRRLPASSRPGLLTLGSFIVRTSVVVLALAVIARTLSWPGVLAGLGGFILARIILVAFYRPGKKGGIETIKEESNADQP